MEASTATPATTVTPGAGPAAEPAIEGPPADIPSVHALEGFAAEGARAALRDACLAIHKRRDGTLPRVAVEGFAAAPDDTDESWLLQTLVKAMLDAAHGVEDDIEFITTQSGVGSRVEPGCTFGTLRMDDRGRSMIFACLRGYMLAVNRSAEIAEAVEAGQSDGGSWCRWLPARHARCWALPSADEADLALSTLTAARSIAEYLTVCRAVIGPASGGGALLPFERRAARMLGFNEGDWVAPVVPIEVPEPSTEAAATPAEGDGMELNAAEQKAMQSAMAQIEEMNGELERAKTAGKLIEASPAGAPADPSLPNRNQVCAETFTKLGLLGKGAVGKCYLVREKGTNMLYAMKVMGKTDITKRLKGQRIMLEREVMAMSKHPLVVSLHISFQSTDFLYHVMEYCPGGPLFGILRRQPYCRFDENTARFYIAECILALEYLHLKGYMYRDLKPENILISAQGHVRLSDFDLVKPMSTTLGNITDGLATDGYMSTISTDRATSFVGTAEYVAPEIVLRKPYSFATEWWSVGILTYEMLIGYTPFVGGNTAATFKRILGSRLVFRDDIPIARDCKDFIKRCLERNPNGRIGFRQGAAELKAHRWLKNVKWSLIANTERPPFIPTTPLMPEAADGADISVQNREHSTVVDRYRLFGRHFQGREGEDGSDPFVGFDWVHPEVSASRQQEDDGNLKAMKATGGDVAGVTLADDDANAKRSAKIVAAAAAALAGT